MTAQVNTERVIPPLRVAPRPIRGAQGQPELRDDRLAEAAPTVPRDIDRQDVLHTVAEHGAWPATLERVDAAAYPAFMQHTDLAPLWPMVYATFPEYQLVLSDARAGRHLAHGNLVPFAWDGTRAGLPRSAGEMVRWALEHRRRGLRTTALGALQVVVNPARQGEGLCVRMLRGMADLAATIGVPDLFAPIRPTHKARYPLTPLERYVGWVRPDGLPLDPWQRVHARLGATPVDVIERWLTVTAPVDDWARWTGMRFPETGRYVVPGALQPVEIDAERGIGRYVEPHLWMHYRISLPRGRRCTPPRSREAQAGWRRGSCR